MPGDELQEALEQIKNMFAGNQGGAFDAYNQILEKTGYVTPTGTGNSGGANSFVANMGFGNIGSNLNTGSQYDLLTTEGVSLGDFNHQQHASQNADPSTTNSLPSIPAISNVGANSFTGVVNWNAIPGGFQPLPQTAGGSKRLYQLSQFHGGINQKSSPRDISDSESREATNVTVSQVGTIKPLGDIKNTDNSIATNAVSLADRGAAGYGLFQFVSPAALDGTAGEYVITLSPDGDTLDAFDSTGTTDGWLDYAGSSDDHDVAHVVYAAGNGVYACDANFAHTSANNPRKTNLYIYRKDYDSSGSAANLITSGWSGTGKPLIDSPTYEGSAITGGSAGADGSVNLEWDDIGAGSNVAFVSTTTAGSATVHIGSDADNAGTWNGGYLFFISWLFDGGVETGLTALQVTGGAYTTGYSFSDERLEFNFSVLDDNSTRNHIGGDSRIDGARVYFMKYGDTERYLLAEVSLVDGIKGALDSTFKPWDEPATNTFNLTSNLIFDNPPEVYTYAALNGYYANVVYDKSTDTLADNTVGPVAHDVRYKTAVVGQQGVVFIGNVKFRGGHKPDLMMYSMPGKPGVFPKFNFFDSPSSDGAPIVALASFQDTILQFKENAMYAINISNPAQFYAEAAFRDCGVSNPCQVFTTAFGVIFANKNGCFIYDGQKVISLTGGKFNFADWGLSESYTATDGGVLTVDDLTAPGSHSAWQTGQTHTGVTQTSTDGSGSGLKVDITTDGSGNTTFVIMESGYNYVVDEEITFTDPGITGNTAVLVVASVSTAGVPCVGYDPRSQSIIVLKNISDNSTDTGAWVYNMLTQSWTEGSSMITNAADNRHTNFIITSEGYLSILRDNNVNIYNYNIGQASSNTQDITYQTKDLDFGLPSQTKKIFKVYVTYFSDDSAVPALTYGKDGGALTGSFDAGAFASSGGLQTTAFTVNDADLTGIKSLALKISGSADHSFEIQDISILYRVRPIK